jgi:hypothetical protein
MPPNASPATAATLKRTAAAMSSRSPAAKKPRTGQGVERYDPTNPKVLAYLCRYVKCFGLGYGGEWHRHLNDMRARSDENGLVPQVYHTRSDEWGRLFPDNPANMVRMPKALRETLMLGISTVHLDFTNCQPTLVVRWCEKKGLEEVAYNSWTYYVANRDEECLKFWEEDTGMGMKEMKDTVNAILYGGRGEFWDVAPKIPRFITKMENQIQAIVAALKVHEPEMWALGVKRDNEKHRDFLREKRDELEKAKTKKAREAIEQRTFPSNAGGSALGFLMCRLERKCLAALDQAGQDLGYWDERATLRFDAIQAVCEEPEAVNVELLEARVADRTGYALKIHREEPDKVKTLDLPEDLSKPPKREVILVECDDEAADIFLDMIQDDVRREEGELFYRSPGSAVWTHCTKPNQEVTELVPICMKAKLYKREKGKGDEGMVYVPYSGDYRGALNIIKSTIPRIPETPGFIESLWWSNKGKLVFNNGYYDFGRGAFVADFEGVNSTIKIPYGFPQRDEAIIQEVWRRVLLPIWGEGNPEMTVWLHHKARVMAGHVEDKMWVVVLGERNAGKGVLQALMVTAFGNYIGVFNLESLKKTKFGSDDGDEAKRNAWMMAGEFSRDLYANEGAADVLSGQRIKKATSGGDLLKGRNLYKDARNFRMQAQLNANVNQLPPADNRDCLQTLLAFTMPYEFFSQEVYDGLSEQKKRVSKVRDDDLKKWCAKPEVGQAFLHILLDHYRDVPADPCESMVAFRDSLMGRSKEEDSEDYFAYTGNNEDFEYTKDVAIVAKQIGTDESTIRARALRFGAEQPKDNRRRRDGGAQLRAINGIKFTDAAREIVRKAELRAEYAY